MKYEIQRTASFVKDYKLAVKRGCDIGKLRAVVELLANGETLPREYRDNALVNSKKYKGVRECHIEPGWLLVYKITENVLVLTLFRTGTHSDLF
ncbi:MAG: type II toxin-antitoxin system YafQ family toxin [Pyramidobacter sp.]|nr:type II toxin-antitoxin system YafQ family toxin [Pyramidobacter sp.]